jgi:nucleoside-diphosphate kinase
MREHYAHIMSKPVFPTLVQFLSHRPVVAAILRGENVIAKVRELLGPTNSKLAPKDTIRGVHGRDRTYNILHASDSPESAQIEIERFFEPEDVFDNVYEKISYADID